METPLSHWILPPPPICEGECEGVCEVWGRGGVGEYYYIQSIQLEVVSERSPITTKN